MVFLVPGSRGSKTPQRKHEIMIVGWRQLAHRLWHWKKHIGLGPFGCSEALEAEKHTGKTLAVTTGGNMVDDNQYCPGSGKKKTHHKAEGGHFL